MFPKKKVCVLYKEFNAYKTSKEKMPVEFKKSHLVKYSRTDYTS